MHNIFSFLDSISIYGYTILTIGAFYLAMQIEKHINSLILNTFIIATILIIITLLIGRIDYSSYFSGNKPITVLLAPSVVALAVPLYQQIHIIRDSWLAIIMISFFSSILAIISSVLLCILFGADQQITMSLLPKSITTPIAMVISNNIGGIPPITIISVVLAGLFGLMFGYPILKKLKIHRHQSFGLSIGAVSHALGTAKCHEVCSTDGNFSSVAMVLCGIIGSIISPPLSRIIIYLFY